MKIVKYALQWVLIIVYNLEIKVCYDIKYQQL